MSQATQGAADRDPYAEGVEAAHNGKKSADCPYPYDTKDGGDWILGLQEYGGLD